jgi:hypothetical protein
LKINALTKRQRLANSTDPENKPVRSQPGQPFFNPGENLQIGGFALATNYWREFYQLTENFPESVKRTYFRCVRRVQECVCEPRQFRNLLLHSDRWIIGVHVRCQRGIGVPENILSDSLRNTRFGVLQLSLSLRP